MKAIFRWSIFIVCSLITMSISAQSIKGVVIDVTKTPLIGATLVWQGTDEGTTTDLDGFFEIERIESTKYLVVSYVGYASDTLEMPEGLTETLVILSDGVDLEGIVITAKERDNFVSTIRNGNIETIGAGELRKAACCNLSESFETTGTVNVSYADAVTGAKEIEMLGLRGVYTQMMLENRPTMRGLGYPFGMEYIPGTWISNISIAKGASTVANGYEGITGNINVELIKPFEGERFFINAFGNHVGRMELNIHANHKINEKWSVGTLLHGNYFKGNIDHNHDNFIDMPQKHQFNGMFRTFYRGNKIRSQINVQALTAQIGGGQLNYKDDPTNLYGFDLVTDRVEVFGKLGYIGFEDPTKSIGFITNLTWHRNDGFFGRKDYDATQRSLYSNLLYQKSCNSSPHNYKFGLSYMLDEYQEVFNDVDYSQTESVGGGFVEYSYTRRSKESERVFALVAGLRSDYHNLHGLLITPRLNLKYNFNDDMVVRLSGGRGYRTARILAENISVLTSAKSISVTEELKAEEAWNTGVNFTKNGQLKERDYSINVDLYTTQFVNQIVLDREAEEQEILFYNLDGRSYSNSFLTTLSYDVLDFLEVKVAYKFNDVKITYNDEIEQVPLVARHRGLLSLGLNSLDDTWKFHTTFNLVGPQRLPKILGHAGHSGEGHGSLSEYQLRGISPTYMTMNAQITKELRNWSFYLGGENLTNYRQENPIIGATDPFDANPEIPTFDASQIYAPVMGIVVYGGVRFTLK